MNENLKSSEFFPAVIHTKLGRPLKITLLKLRQGAEQTKTHPVTQKHQFPLLPTVTVVFRKPDLTKNQLTGMPRSQKKYYSSSSAMSSICITQQPRTWLQSEGETTL